MLFAPKFLSKNSAGGSANCPKRCCFQIISFGNKPSAVPEQLISQLKQRVDQNKDSVITDLPQKDDQLKVLDGPFRGLNAIFSQIDGDSRAIVLITILSQKVRAVLPLASLSHSQKVSVKAL